MLKDIQPRLTELGKIKIGRKSAQARQSQGGKAWRAPEKIDHFIITTRERDEHGDLVEDGRLLAELRKLAGNSEKLVEIPIEVPSDDIDTVLSARWCYYGSRKLWGVCDETTCTWYVDSDGKQLVDDKGRPAPKSAPCKGEHKQKAQEGKPGWKVHAIFNCMIKASAESVLGGVYKFRTTSQISVSQLYGSLVEIKARMRVLEGLPLKLVLRPIEVAPNGRTTKVYVVHVELRAQDLVALQQSAASLAEFRAKNAKQIEAARVEYQRLLGTPGVDEEPEEQAEVADEFQPEEPAAQETPPAAAPAETAPTVPLPTEAQLDQVLEASREVAQAAPQDRQLQEELPPEPPPEESTETPLARALRLIDEAKDNAQLGAAFKAATGLPKAERDQLKGPYNAKYAQLNQRAGASHA